MSIAAKETLDTLNMLINGLSSVEGIECVQLCVTIEHILDKLEIWSQTSINAKEKHPYCSTASQYIVEMKMPLYCIAGISDFGHDKVKCIVWLISGIRKLAAAKPVLIYLFDNTMFFKMIFVYYFSVKSISYTF